MSSINSICIIDDDKIYTYGVTKIIKNLLPEKQIMSFENGRKALDALKNLESSSDSLPDLILLDIDMPEMNGWDFLQEFEVLHERIEKDIPVFVISSRVNSSNQELYKVEWDNKVSDFIQKPVDIETFRELLA